MVSDSDLKKLQKLVEIFEKYSIPTDALNYDDLNNLYKEIKSLSKKTDKTKLDTIKK